MEGKGTVMLLVREVLVVITITTKIVAWVATLLAQIEIETAWAHLPQEAKTAK